MIDAKKTFQTIEGFGGAITDASAETFYKLPADKQKEILNAYFNPTEGIGYSLCRTHINSCDFSSESYAYSEVEGDVDLKNFSISHDMQFRIPLIKAAIEKTSGKLTFFASPWSPPAWMKTNNNMLQGGKLKPEYFQAWANYYIKFIQEYQKQGISMWGLTVQNEAMAVQTWESCIYTAEEERDFVKNFLGPTLEKAGLGNIKLMIWDHNRGIMYQRASTVFDDPEASKYVWGTAFHWYTGDHFENVKMVNEAFPDKKILFTEGCIYPFDYNRLNEWQWGEQYGKSIINDLNNSAVGWVDWNILLDENGGPNHVANYCYAPVIGNTKTGEVFYMNSFYYLGHFSKFIRPGAKRIACSTNDDNLLATAMINPDGTIAVVALNLTDNEFDYKVWINNKVVTTKCHAHSISTILIN
jgi:glucosylceramidase